MLLRSLQIICAVSAFACGSSVPRAVEAPPPALPPEPETCLPARPGAVAMPSGIPAYDVGDRAYEPLPNARAVLRQGQNRVVIEIDTVFLACNLLSCHDDEICTMRVSSDPPEVWCASRPPTVSP